MRRDAAPPWISNAAVVALGMVVSTYFASPLTSAMRSSKWYRGRYFAVTSVAPSNRWPKGLVFVITTSNQPRRVVASRCDVLRTLLMVIVFNKPHSGFPFLEMGFPSPIHL